jgi:protein gp37
MKDHYQTLQKDWYTIAEWNALSEDERLRLFYASDKKMNKQDSTSIEWAQWSWNPITGCKHDCPYCYARDIANRFYKQKFEPSIYPARFNAPKNTNVPEKADEDVSFRNVFTGSMADIFGRWVPDEWVHRVIGVVKECPQWNFLFLTKFPQRVHEYEKELPSNAWMGTTVDCQDRVANAEKAFSKMSGGTKWLSIEPMLTPLRFERLDLFDWVVIGGASPSAQTPKWTPPFDWISDLHQQARDAGCKIYHKDNLGLGDDIRLREFPWTETSNAELPEKLKYLGIK